MDSPYGKFIYESHTERDFTVFVTAPSEDPKRARELLEVARFIGGNAVERGRAYYNKCLGLPA